MTTNEPGEVLDCLSEDKQILVMALGIVNNRIRSLSPADRNDLFELMTARFNTNDHDEQESIRRAMIEILTQGKVQTKSLQLTADNPLSENAKKWAAHVGKKIKQLRDAAGLTQAQLSELSGLPQSHISRLERAEYTPTHITLLKLAKCSQCSSWRHRSLC